MKACIERVKADPASRKCLEDRYMGPELDLEKLSACPRGSLGYTYAKVMTYLGYAPHFYADRPSTRKRPTGSRCASARPTISITSSPGSP